jgi:hypothetical protein
MELLQKLIIARLTVTNFFLYDNAHPHSLSPIPQVSTEATSPPLTIVVRRGFCGHERYFLGMHGTHETSTEN